MTPHDILDFLTRNPTFFDEHPELLSHLSVPHPVGGKAISLTERQLLNLREKLAQVQHKLGELVAFGEENDVITERIHRLTLALLGAGDFNAALWAIHTHLRDDFSVPHVALRLWNATPARATPEFIDASESLRFQAADMRHPQCGTTQNEEVLAWFGEAAPQLRSSALIPLRQDGRTIGMLALASEDPQRFFAGMGTLYIERIGDIVAAAILRQLEA